MYATKTLQGVGTVWAKPAGQLAPDDVTIWNCGYTYRVLGVAVLSPKFVRLALVCTNPDRLAKREVVYRRTRADFLVGFVG
jgi:hypothetical protein